MKLLFDEMLKKLSHWSRIFGIDSEYFTGKTDTELLDYAEKNGLVFVTRDVGLCDRCKKHSVRCVFIESDELVEQLAQLIRESGAEPTFPDRMRCAGCNGVLEPGDRNILKDKIPADVYNEAKEVWQCHDCKKVYWEGGHWKNITRIYNSVKKRLESETI